MLVLCAQWSCASRVCCNSMGPRKLRFLALHSFRTSAAIFQDQIRRSGLDKALVDIIELVYIDAPIAATGPAPADVAPFFGPPYYEWWNATQDPETKEWHYVGAEESFQQVSSVIAEQGPFDGLWAFSQGAMLASIMISLQRQGELLQSVPPLRCAMIFGGFHNKARLKVNKLAQRVFRLPIDVPSLHCVGDRDPIRAGSMELLSEWRDAVLVTHQRGHVIPALEGEKLDTLRMFLEQQRAAAIESEQAGADAGIRQASQDGSKL